MPQRRSRSVIPVAVATATASWMLSSLVWLRVGEPLHGAASRDGRLVASAIGASARSFPGHDVGRAGHRATMGQRWDTDGSEPSPEVVGLLNLQVSSPAMFLNHIAERYASTSRIIMEFVDNALDDAESMFDTEANAYTRPVNIDIVVDSKEGTLSVTDNCRGMAPAILGRVTTNVGESQKRGQPFLNGQFGFGMQAFRACCSTLVVRSRAEVSKPLLEIEVSRDISTGITLKEASAASSSVVQATGTQIVLKDFAEQWATEEALSPSVIQAEIEAHFERLLARQNLTVTVSDNSSWIKRVCKPLVYEAFSAEVIVQDLVALGGGQRAQVLLAVANQTAAATMSPARFFAKGRRIGEIASIGSFVKDSAHRWDVWTHPQLVGFIDVIGDDAGPLQPMITRDEFKNTRLRRKAYRRLAQATEGPLSDALANVNEAKSITSLKHLEDVLTTELHRVNRQEKRALRKKLKESFADPLHAPEGDEDESEERQEEELPQTADVPEAKQQEQGDSPAHKTMPEFKVMLSEGLPSQEDEELADAPEEKRSMLLGNTIIVNVQHNDFRDRYKRTRAGAPKIDERLCSYLANIISAHYRDLMSEGGDTQSASRLEAFDGMITTYCRYEERLRKALPSIARAIAEGEAR